MKQIIFIFMSLLCFSCSSKAQNQTANTDVQSDKKILVAYFSCTGTTEKVADAIAKTVGSKLYRITPAAAYTSADLNWNNKSSRSSVEMTTENSRPELGGETLNLKDVLGSIMLMRATFVLKDMSLTVGNCKGRMFMSPPKGWHDSISLE